MHKVLRFISLIILATNYILIAQNLNYPASPKIEHVDDYNGIKINDDYRWLEDLNSEQTKTWVEKQNNLTESYLSKIQYRDKIKSQLTEIWNYEKYSAPSKIGEHYIFSKNDGLQEQSIVYIQKGLNGAPEVFLDPNKLSNDGSVSLAGLTFSNDYKYAGYGISKGGSDWREFYVMDVSTKQLTGDIIKWAKFTGLAWYKDGFFYSRYDEPKPGEELKQKNEFQKLFYHKLGTSQSEDKLVIEDKENPKRGWGASVTDDEKFLIISVWEGSSSKNMMWFKNLEENSSIIKLTETPDASYDFIENNGDMLFITTNLDAPNNKVVLVDSKNPSKNNWKVIIPESKDVIQSVSLLDNKLFVYSLSKSNNIRMLVTVFCY